MLWLALKIQSAPFIYVLLIYKFKTDASYNLCQLSLIINTSKILSFFYL